MGGRAMLRACAALATLPSAAVAARPNFVFVLADDLDYDYKQDRKAVMPTLKRRLADGGLEFRNHVAVVSVCGPSRSSLLAGRFPHNTGYVANARAASVAAWAALQDDTVGAWLTKAGYHTAFLGKYVNGMECNVPKGWGHWGGLTCGYLHTGGKNPTAPPGLDPSRYGPLGGTYNFYNASQWQVDFDASGGNSSIDYKVWTGVHQGEFLGNATVEQARKAVEAGKPFFIHTTPVMVHVGTCYGPQPADQYAATDPYHEKYLFDPSLNSKGKVKGNRSVVISPCPSTRHAWDFAGLRAPHLPSWNASEEGTVPDQIALIGDTDKRGCCDEWEAGRQDMGYRNRTSSCVDLDDMLATIFDGLEGLGVLGQTYVIFSADNGYHLGEHRLLFGKTEPYETDVRLPMYITGPGVPRGGSRAHPTTHLDITATIADLAGAAQYSPHPLDGKSFASALTADPPAVAAWRDFSFSEFYVNTNTWRMIRRINATTGDAAWTFHWWCSNQSEVFNLASDPYQMVNLGGDTPTPFGASIQERYLSATEALGACAGAACNAMPPPAAASAHPLPCHNVLGELLDVEEAWLDP